MKLTSIRGLPLTKITTLWSLFMTSHFDDLTDGQLGALAQPHGVGTLSYALAERLAMRNRDIIEFEKELAGKYAALLDKEKIDAPSSIYEHLSDFLFVAAITAAAMIAMALITCAMFTFTH